MLAPGRCRCPSHPTAMSARRSPTASGPAILSNGALGFAANTQTIHGEPSGRSTTRLIPGVNGGGTWNGQWSTVEGSDPEHLHLQRQRLPRLLAPDQLSLHGRRDDTTSWNAYLLGDPVRLVAVTWPAPRAAVRNVAWTSPSPPSTRCCGRPCATSPPSSATSTSPRSRAPAASADELWQAVADLGFLSVHLPEEYGGGGGGMSELAIVCEELAAAGLPAAADPRVARDLRPSSSARFGTDAQKRPLAAADRRPARRWCSRSPSPTPARTATTSRPPRRATATSTGCSGTKTYISGVDEAAADARGRRAPAPTTTPGAASSRSSSSTPTRPGSSAR